MIYLLLAVSALNLLLTLGVAGALGKMLSLREGRGGSAFQEGYARGRADLLSEVQRQMARHQGILPEWVVDWVNHLGEQSRQTSLKDVPVRFQGQVDYSNLLELQSSPEDVKMLRDI